jgi:L-asparaginase II
VEHVARVAPLAEVVRSGFVESVHLGALVGLNVDGDIALSIGDIDAVILPRSSLKPLQSLACHTAGAALTARHLAIAAGSHTGEDFHVAAVSESSPPQACPPTRCNARRTGPGTRRPRLGSSTMDRADPGSA